MFIFACYVELPDWLFAACLQGTACYLPETSQNDILQSVYNAYLPQHI